MAIKRDFKTIWPKLDVFRHYNEIEKCTFRRKKSLSNIWGNKNLVRLINDRFNYAFVVNNDSIIIIDAMELLNRVSNKTFFVKTISNGIQK